MTYKEETYLLDTVTENNVLLKKVLNILNAYLINHQKENEEDFGRNVVANLLSEVLTYAKKKG